jgi:bacterioferritin (cytochrome b1)
MNVSYLEHEDEGVYHPYEMVQHDLAHEGLMTERLLISIETAQDLEDSGTEAVLKRVLNGSQERAVNLQRLLDDLLSGQGGLTA